MRACALGDATVVVMLPMRPPRPLYRQSACREQVS
jgi:hypothetical protein